MTMNEGKKEELRLKFEEWSSSLFSGGILSNFLANSMKNEYREDKPVFMAIANKCEARIGAEVKQMFVDHVESLGVQVHLVDGETLVERTVREAKIEGEGALTNREEQAERELLFLKSALRAKMKANSSLREKLENALETKEKAFENVEKEMQLLDSIGTGVNVEDDAL